MVRRWCIPLTTMALVIGSLLAAASASAAPRAAHSALSHPAAAQGFVPGGRMIKPAAGQRPSAGPGVVNAEVQSTNWSGYAATGANGAFSSVSASWTEPAATCTSNRRRTAQYAAFWVGLDGYSSGSVEQTGTDSDCVELLRLVRDVPVRAGVLQQHRQGR